MAMQRSSGGAACASCKHQRKKCSEKCELAPYFPADRAEQFHAVQKVFGVSNVTKLLKAIGDPQDRFLAVDTLIWEAECRQRNLVLGPYAEYQKMSDEKRRLEEIVHAMESHVRWAGSVVPNAWSSGWNNHNNNNNNNNNNSLVTSLPASMQPGRTVNSVHSNGRPAAYAQEEAGRQGRNGHSLLR